LPLGSCVFSVPLMESAPTLTEEIWLLSTSWLNWL
jgi:hypothetical protein